MRMGVAIILGVALLAGCAGSPDDASMAAGFPSLRDVPTTTDANTDAAHWAAVEAEMKALGEAVRANPRAQPVTADDNPTLFLEQARTDLEQARQAHEPN